MTKYY